MRFSRGAQRWAAEAALRRRRSKSTFSPGGPAKQVFGWVGSGLVTLYFGAVASTCTDGAKELDAVVKERWGLVKEQHELMNRFALELDAAAGGADVDVDFGVKLTAKDPFQHPAIAVRRFMQHEDERDAKERAMAAARVDREPSDLRHEAGTRRELVEKLRVFNWRSAMAMSIVLDWRAASSQLPGSSSQHNRPQGFWQWLRVDVWQWLRATPGSVHVWVQAMRSALLSRSTTTLAHAHRPYVAACVVNAELLYVADLIVNAVMSPVISDKDLLSIAPWLEDPRVKLVVEALQVYYGTNSRGTGKPMAAPPPREWLEAKATEAQLDFFGDDRRRLRDVLKEVLTTTRPLPLSGETETHSRGDEVKFVVWVVEKLGVAGDDAIAKDVVGPLITTDMSRLAFFYGLLVLAREGLEAKRKQKEAKKRKEEEAKKKKKKRRCCKWW